MKKTVKTELTPFEKHDGAERLIMNGIWGEEYEVDEMGNKHLVCIYMRVKMLGESDMGIADLGL